MLWLAGLVALTVAAVVGTVGRRWPRVDPTAPTGRGVADELAEHPDLADDLEDVGPRPVTVLGLSVAAVAAVACTAVFGVLFVAVRSRVGFTTMDLGPARWAGRSATPAAADGLHAITWLGSVAVALPLVALVGLLEHRRRANRSIFAFLLLVEGGQLLLANAVKVLVDRARPDIRQLAEVASFSFPSGHTTTAAATFAALALLVGRGRSPATRSALAAAAAGLTALVGASRVLLGVHWVSDVLAGAALGWGWAALCSIAFGGRLLRFGAPVEQGVAAAAELATAGRPSRGS